MIIMLSSRLPQQGKDTACDYIIKQYGGKRVSFADSLKNIASMIGWDGQKNEKGRQLLIDLGMIARKYDDSVWIKLAIEKIRTYVKEGYTVIITDARFINEVKNIKSFFTRTNIIHIGISSDIIGDKSRENDESQIDFDKMIFDYEITTDTNKNNLYKQIDEIIIDLNNKGVI